MGNSWQNSAHSMGLAWGTFWSTIPTEYWRLVYPPRCPPLERDSLDASIFVVTLLTRQDDQRTTNALATSLRCCCQLHHAARDGRKSSADGWSSLTSG